MLVYSASQGAVVAHRIKASIPLSEYISHDADPTSFDHCLYNSEISKKEKVFSLEFFSIILNIVSFLYSSKSTKSITPHIDDKINYQSDHWTGDPVRFVVAKIPRKIPLFVSLSHIL